MSRGLASPGEAMVGAGLVGPGLAWEAYLRRIT